MNHLLKCDGYALIVIDEVQKVMPGALDALMPGLRERGSYETAVLRKRLFGNETETYGEVSTSNAIFLFISDLGVGSLENDLLYYQDRNNIPNSALRSSVKEAVDMNWQSLDFSKLISQVIPFLPMEPEQMEEVFQLKVREFALQFKKIRWADLIVSASAAKYLSGENFIEYRHRSENFRVRRYQNTEVDISGEMKAHGSSPSSDMIIETRKKTFAKDGGRAFEVADGMHSEGMQQLIFFE